MTKPLRVASNGREAMDGTYSPVSGSIGVPSACIWPKPAKASGTRTASVPAPSIRSAWPRMIVSIASPMAWLPVAHALTTAMLGPRIPYWMATIPDGLSTSMCGGSSTATPGWRPRPSISSRSSSRTPDPAAAGAEHHPEAIGVGLLGSASGPSPLIRPASRSASAVAATAKWVERSWRRTSLRSISWVGSKSFTSPPIRMSWSDSVGDGDLADAGVSRHEVVPRRVVPDPDR